MSDIVRMLRAELAATRELEMKACKEVDRLNAELAAANARHSAPPYVFRRFKGGNEMAEGLIIKNAETLEHAIAKAAWFYPGTGTVFVIEDVDARKERDEARAELAAERKKNKLTKLRFQQAQQMIKHLSQRSSTGSERPPSKREVEGSSPSVEATFRDELAAERERNAAPSEYDLALLADRDALRAERDTLRAELAAAKVPLCVGQPIISILAKDGLWTSEDGQSVVAASDLFGADPYAERDTLRAELAAERDEARAELATALDALAAERTLREHETKRANDNYASLTKHWLNESKLRELLTEIVEYNGGEGHALADEYVVARIDAALAKGGGE